ncbi:MAG TPA: acyl-CoA dehydrogenase family protein [Vicinamibacteria bacterium]|nr:acyl-CoA dehydrogenase family protein [Vicinamibacteria bacterium]
MIDFELTEDHRSVEDMVRGFSRKEVAPHIQENDSKKHFDRSILKKMAALNILGICVPEQYGGAGLDYISLGLACEELEYVDTSLRVIMSVHVGLNSLSLLAWGNEKQKTRYLAPQARGEKIATYGLTEPNAGSDAVGIQATAIKKGDRYVLNGEKQWISLAEIADHFLVIAWTDQAKKKARDHSGLSAFIVERGFRGFDSGSMTHKWGIKAGNTGWFKMTDVEVPEENLLGKEGEGFRIAMFALDQGRYTVAAGATGLIRACLDESVKWARERHAFGVPIGQHQLVKQMIAHMVRDYDCSRLLWIRAGDLKNRGRRNTRETSLAKWYSTVASERAASDAIQIFGSYGYSDEYPVGRFWRNSKGAVIYEGTREIHTLMQADYALGYRVDKPTRVTLPAYPKST